ncbi:MAG: hypothetical protein ACLUGU_18015 [Alistipes shahii]
MGRITINGTMSQFSCKLTVRSSLWNAKANKASGKSLESQCVKRETGKYQDQYPQVVSTPLQPYVTAEKVCNFG